MYEVDAELPGYYDLVVGGILVPFLAIVAEVVVYAFYEVLLVFASVGVERIRRIDGQFGVIGYQGLDYLVRINPSVATVETVSLVLEQFCKFYQFLEPLLPPIQHR